MSPKRRGEISITFMSGPLDGKTLPFEFGGNEGTSAMRDAVLSNL